MFPQKRDEYFEDLFFLSKIFIVCLIGISIGADVPEQNLNTSYPSVENGDCRRFDGDVVCFGTWDVLGFDTGFPVALYSYEKVDTLNISKKIFYHESDFVSGSGWDEASRISTGNFSGSVPDYNVSVVGGTSME